MKKPIRVALVGMGKTGQVFAEHFQKSRERGVPLEIVAVSGVPEGPAASDWSYRGTRVYKDACEITALGDQVDIIFDLSGDRAMRQQLRLALLKNQNVQTVLVSETIARLMWFCLGETAEPPLPVSDGY
jgi:hypothetical protein